MANAPIVAMDINRNSENISPLRMLSKASLRTGKPTGM
jgi:hypothetical protein